MPLACVAEATGVAAGTEEAGERRRGVAAAIALALLHMGFRLLRVRRVSAERMDNPE